MPRSRRSATTPKPVHRTKGSYERRELFLDILSGEVAAPDDVNFKFALIDAGLSQLIYLVLFSYAFFFEGFTGLAVTIGAILTLFVVMQMTGRIRWEEKFAKQPG